MRATQVTKYIARQSGLVLTIAASVALMAVGVTTRADEIPNGTPNNPIPSGAEVCDLDIGFLIDRSNSIRNDSESNPGIISSAIRSVTTDLKGTDTRVAVWSFGTMATGYTGDNPLKNTGDDVIVAADYPGRGFTSVKQQSGVNAVNNTVVSIPYGTDREKETAQQKHLVYTGFTNWQAGLKSAVAGSDRPKDADIVFVLSDGDPNFYINQEGEGVWDSDRSGDAARAGVNAADEVKATGNNPRIVVLAVGDTTSDQNYIDNIQRITGGLGNAELNSDYYTGNFNQLGTMLSNAISQACEEITPDDPPEVIVSDPGPKDLPKTGVGSTLAIFSSVAVLGAGLYKFRFAQKTKKASSKRKR